MRPGQEHPGAYEGRQRKVIPQPPDLPVPNGVTNDFRWHAWDPGPDCVRRRLTPILLSLLLAAPTRPRCVTTRHGGDSSEPKHEPPGVIRVGRTDNAHTLQGACWISR